MMTEITKKAKTEVMLMMFLMRMRVKEMIRSLAFTGGEKFRLENFWQFAEIMGIRREYSLRVLSGKSLGRGLRSYGSSYHTQ